MAEAFALREAAQGTIESLDDDGNPVQVEKFRGATFALRTGETFDVKEHLDDSDGVIVTDDPELAELLRHVTVLKPVPVPAGHPTVTPLTAMTATALRDLPEASQVTGAGRMKREELAYRIALVRGGDDPNVELVDKDGSFAVKRDDDGGDES